MKNIWILLLLISAMAYSQQPVFEKATFEHEGKTLNYQILKPADFDTSKKYPLHIFLHGAGERGSDNEAQLIHGSDLFVKENKEHPAIVIFPQCPEGDYWAQIEYSRDETTNSNVFKYPKESTTGWALGAVINLMDTMLAKNYIDKERVYLGGLSMGGMGTFELLVRRPNTFAAATVICGGGNIENVQKWATTTPVWIFHGEKDQVVHPFYSKSIAEELSKQGVTPKLTIYPEAGHDSWTAAFTEPDFFDWIYSHKKEITSDCTPEWLKFSEATLQGKYKEANQTLRDTDTSNSIVFMGDSITEGWLTTSPDFWKEYPEFINRGVSGQTTSQMLVRFRQDVINIQPKRVIILAGTNDIAGNTGVTSLETIASNIFSMADLAVQNNIQVVIASVLPAYDYPWKPGLQPASKIIQLNEMLRAFAKANNHTYLDYHTPMKDTRNGLQETYTYDMVHCTSKGYQKMEEILVESLDTN